jgi:hypothetical protein
MRRSKYALNLQESLVVDAVENLVAALNEAEPQFPEGKRYLLELISKWEASGRNVAVLLKKDTAVAEAFKRGWAAIPLPTNDGGLRLFVKPAPQGKDLSPGSAFALQLFMNFIVHRGWRNLGGPCPRCGKFYVKKTVRQTIYCERRCATGTTAAAANNRRLERQRAANLKLVRDAIEKWKRGSKRQEWKRFVANETMLSLHYITRALNQGKIEAPRESFQRRC